MNPRFSLLMALLGTACISSPEPEIRYPLEAHRDSDFFPVYESVSKSYEVIHNFEAKYTLHITRLTPAFREALNKRYEQIWNENPAILKDISGKTAFFASIYTANRNLENINDAELWNIQLLTAGKALKPKSIQMLKPKERWQPFFPKINQWSNDYLLVFDYAAEGSSGSLKLMISSPDGSVRSDW